jgi:oxygen-dependent protoporphyrinogen oxidase
MSTERLVVIGAGIAGLGAAHAARRPGREILVVDAAPDVGGKARTVRDGDWLVEAGPTGFLDKEPLLDELVTAAGLTKLPADELAARRFLYLNGRLRELKANPVALVTGGILTVGGFARLACEPFVRQRKASEPEESVYDFARRRLGSQAADRLIAPMVLGVFAGDARRLSLPAAFPRMAELESEYGSLVKALIKLKSKGGASGGPSGPSGKLTSFADGLQSLPRALAERGEFEVRTGSQVNDLHPADDGWRMRVDGEELAAATVVVAAPTRATAALVRPFAADVADPLEVEESPPVAVVALGYGPSMLATAPRGFGCLVPRTEGIRTLGLLWDTHLFPGRSPDGHLLVRAMLGGSTDAGLDELDDDALIATARADAARILGSDDAPVFSQLTRWSNAIPQMELGHAARQATMTAALDALRARHPGLHLVDEHRTGVSFGLSAAAGVTTGRKLEPRSAHR